MYNTVAFSILPKISLGHILTIFQTVMKPERKAIQFINIYRLKEYLTENNQTR
jgi:hypothetical protein